MLDSQINSIICGGAAKLIGRGGFTQQDRESIKQDLTTHVIEKLAEYDPKLGQKNGFVSTVVQRRLLTLLRSRTAGKRDTRGVTSLSVDVAVPGEANEQLASTVSERELDSRLHRHRRSDQEIRSLASDLSKVLSELPPQWQQMLQLRATMNMAEVAAELKIPRTTLNSWMNEIRVICEAAGLGEYLH